MLLDRDQPDDQTDSVLQREQRLTLVACALTALDGVAVEAVIGRRAGLTHDLRVIVGRIGVAATIRRSRRYLVVRFAPGGVADSDDDEPAGLLLS
jgi:hypothetical protein